MKYVLALAVWLTNVTFVQFALAQEIPSREPMPPDEKFIYGVIIVVFVIALISFGVIRAAVANSKFSLADALSEDAELTILTKDSAGNEVPTLGQDGKPLTRPFTQTEIAARQAKQKIVYTGFMAQDVEKAAKDLGFDFSGVDAAKNEKDLYGLRYSEFVVPLVRAVQELSERTETLHKENEELKKKLSTLEELKNRFQKWEAAMGGKNSGATSLQEPKNVPENTANLEQNTPNPATGSTRISYRLPAGTTRAQLLLTDISGKTVRTVPLTTAGSIEIDTAGISSGVYTYSLVVNDKVVETKRLTVVR